MTDDLSPLMRRMRKAYHARRGVDLDAVDLGAVDPAVSPLLTEAALDWYREGDPKTGRYALLMSIADRARVKGNPVDGEGALRDLKVTGRKYKKSVRKAIADDCVPVIWRSRT
jgi:hypothetical protein